MDKTTGWKLLPAKRNFSLFEDHWNILNKRLNKSHPMLDSQFVLSLISHFSSDEILLAIYKSNGVIENMLIVEKKGIFQWATFQPSQIQISCAIISNYKVLKGLISMLGWKILAFDLLLVDPRFSLEVFNNEKYKYVNSTTIDINIQKDFESYWNLRPRKLKQNIRRYIKRATEKFGEVSIVCHRNKENITQALKRYGDIETQGWKGKIGTAIYVNNQQGQFYKEILERFSDKHQAVIYELYLGKELVASRIAIYNSEMLIMLKTTYRENYKKFAPGRCLLYMAIEYEFKTKNSLIIEFYTNASKEQLEWSTGRRNIFHLRVYRNEFFGRLIEYIKSIKNRIKKMA